MGGTYTVTLNNGCTASTTTSVVVNATPTVIANATANTICEGENVTLSGSGADSYVWDNSVNDGISFNPTATNTYTVTGTSLEGCTDTDQTTVTVNTLPTVVANASTTILCSGGTVTLTGSGTATSYVWDNGASDGIAFSPTTTLTYTVTGSNGNCEDTDQVTVTVNDTPTVDYSETNDTLCLGASSISLTAGTPTGGNYSGTGVSGNTFDPSIAGVGTHSIIYTFTDGNGCFASDVSNVSVVNCASIAELESSFATIVVPNPTTGEFTIQWLDQTNDKIRIEIFDNIGKIIFTQEISEGVKQSFIDLTPISRGIYHIRITSGERIGYNKLIKD
jgi:hypothetical protein